MTEAFKLPKTYWVSEHVESNTYNSIVILYCPATGMVAMEEVLLKNGGVKKMFVGGRKSGDESAIECAQRKLWEELSVGADTIFPIFAHQPYKNFMDPITNLPSVKRKLWTQYFLAIVDKEVALDTMYYEDDFITAEWYTIPDIQRIADEYDLYNARTVQQVFGLLGVNIQLRSKTKVEI